MTTIDNVYAQRNELAIAFAKAALAAGWKAGRGIDSEASPEWANVVYVDLPDGRQVSWHMSPDCVPLLDGLPQYAGTWDGTFIGREPGWSRGIEVVAQQEEPDHETRAELAEQQVVQLAEERDHYRNLWQKAQQAEPVEPVAWLVMDESGYVQHAASWRDAAHEHINDAINEHDLVCARTWRVVPVYTAPPQQVAQQAEPLNLSDPAVRKRLASQWGYVHDTQQALTQQKDPTDPGNDVDVLREHVRHLERRVRQLHAQQAEPVAGVVLNEEGRAALVEHGREEWHCVSRNARRLYTAPPQRKLVPLTEAEIEHIGITHQSLRQVARAVERAVWEKNNG